MVFLLLFLALHKLISFLNVLFKMYCVDWTIFQFILDNTPKENKWPYVINLSDTISEWFLSTLCKLLQLIWVQITIWVFRYCRYPLKSSEGSEVHFLVKGIFSPISRCLGNNCPLSLTCRSVLVFRNGGVCNITKIQMKRLLIYFTCKIVLLV